MKLAVYLCYEIYLLNIEPKNILISLPAKRTWEVERVDK